MAGESAEEVARRTREKIARLNQHAQRFEKGAAGEVITAAALGMLPPAHWTVIHDVRWPGRRVANIDHVAVGPGGIFVIDSKNWSGRVDVRDGVLRRDGYRRQRETSGCVDAAVAVAGLVPSLDPRLVHPVLCLVGRDFAPTYAGGALVCSTSNVVEILRRHPAALTPTEVRRVSAQLRRALQSATDPRPRSHVPSTGRVAPPGAGRTVQATGSIPRRRPARIARLLIAVAACCLLGLLALSGIAALLSVAANSARGHATTLPGTSSSPGADESVRLGTTHQFPRATGRPPLAVAAHRVRTVHSVGEAPVLITGNRWVAVQISIHNRGRRLWPSQPGTEWLLEDDLGIPHRSQGEVSIGAGKTLPDTLLLRPGQTIRGWVVFQVGTQTPVVEASVTVGPGRPATASWAVDRQ